ncbi:hypothetical protein [Catenovulum maritimum]|uniref:AsmA domain-containing protein n=1 Tax=Catenovulum maritimum TaxID=1513271 RepID=A0A0J8GRC8_9ALTE|nr:hypothetical protein [Catenovulum maritimum]KMT63809.1 hypothetical protein XM47_17830 [Catenovulum maritimum]
MRLGKVLGYLVIGCFLLVVAADLLLDRTKLAQEQLKTLNQKMPFELKLEQISHTIFNPTSIQVEGLEFKDEFGTLVKIPKVYLYIDLIPLINKQVIVEKIAIEDIYIQSSQAALLELQTAMANLPKSNDPAAESPSPESAQLPLEQVLIKSLVFSIDELAFKAEAGDLALAKLMLELSDLSIIEQGQLKPELIRVQISNSIAKVEFNQYQINQIKLLASLDTGSIKLDELSLETFDGQLNLAANVDFLEQINIEVSKLSLSNINADLLVPKPESQAETKPVEAQPTAKTAANSKVPSGKNNKLAKTNKSNTKAINAPKTTDATTDTSTVKQVTSANTQPTQVAENAQTAEPIPDQLPEQISAADRIPETQQQVPAQTSQTVSKPPVEDAELPIHYLAINQLAIDNIKLTLTDPATAQAWLALTEFGLTLDQIKLVEQQKLVQFSELKPGSNLMIQFAEFIYLTPLAQNLAIAVKTKDAGANLDGELELAQGKIDLDTDITETDKIIKLAGKIDWQQINFAVFKPILADSPVLPTGVFTGNTILDASYNTNKPGLAGVDGQVQLTTDKFGLKGIQLDKMLSAFKSSQETSLLDVGAFLVSGPLGVMAMQLAELSSAATATGGTTEINSIDINANISDQVINLKLADIKTKAHHLGLYGDVNLAAKQFEKFQFGLLDSEGCAPVQQTLDGPFSEVKDILFNTTKGAATSSITSVFNNVGKLAGKKCKPFYKSE